MVVPSRSARAARWLAPSVVAACLGAVVAGLVEGVDGGLGGLGAPASAGFAAALAIPVFLIGALAVRGLWAAWRPHRLAPTLIEDGGGAPRLGAWIVYLAVALFLLSWATFNGTRLVARHTTFKVNVVSIALPIVVVVFALVLVAISRPSVDLIAAGLRTLDRRLSRRVGRSLLSPRILLGGTLAITGALALFAWFVTIKPRLGDLDAGIFVHPVTAGVVTAAAHPLWRRVSARLRMLAIVVPTLAATAGISAAAVWVRAERPSLMLRIWAQPSIGGLAIDTIFDVDDVRSKASLEKYRPVARPGAPRRSIVLITIDTLRYDHTPFGNGRAVMPNLAALGEKGVVFERATSPSNTTRRSVPALILGLSPGRIRGRVVGWALKLDPRHVPLAERLAIAGYRSAGFFCCDNFWDPSRKTGYSRGLEEVYINTDGEEIAEHARAWIVDYFATPRDEPAFVWLHFLEPHNWSRVKNAPATGAPDGRSRKYDRKLSEVDDDLAGLVAAINAIPEDRRPLIVITSDHGEGLGDHGALHHSSNLYQSQVHVPWVIAGPGISPRRILEPVSGTDLAPTLLELAGFEPPGMPDMDGVSVADLVTGARKGDPDAGYAYAVMVKDRSTPTAARAITRGNWKLIENAKGLELYDLRADPKEVRNVLDDHPDVAEELKALLEERAVIDATSPF